MWANVENYTGEGSVSAFDDGNVFHSRTETRCRHIVVGADVMLVLAVVVLVTRMRRLMEKRASASALLTHMATTPATPRQRLTATRGDSRPADAHGDRGGANDAQIDDTRALVHC